MVLLPHTLLRPAVADAAPALVLMPSVVVAGQDAEYTVYSHAGSPQAALLAEAGSALRWWAYEQATSPHPPLPPHPRSPHLPGSVAAYAAVSRMFLVPIHHPL